LETYVPMQERVCTCWSVRQAYGKNTLTLVGS